MSIDDLTAWLTSFVADLLDISPDEVDADATFADLGVDSATSLVLAGDLSAQLRRPVSPVTIREHPTIAGLAAALSRAPQLAATA
jgi:acyl carrier protein